MQQTVIEEPRVRGVGGGGGERALTTFKIATAFKRGFTPSSSLKRGFTLRLCARDTFKRGSTYRL